MKEVMIRHIMEDIEIFSDDFVESDEEQLVSLMKTRKKVS